MKKFRFGILFLVLIALSGFTVFAKTHKDDIVVIDRIEYTLEEKDKYSAELFVEEDGLYIIKVLSLSSVEGVRQLTPHSCRHTYVSQMQALGVDLQTIQSIVGHADIDMTQHYLHVQDSIRQNAIGRFAEAFSKAEPEDT